MKILHVISSADPKGGGPIEGVKQRARLLIEMGHTVEVASCDDPNADFAKDFPLTLHAMGPGRTGFRYAPGLKDWLDRNVKNYDAVIVNGIWQYHCFAAHRAAKAAGVPYWVFTHGMLDPWFNQEYPAKKLKKSIIWPWQHSVLKDAKAVLFTSEEEKISARQSFSPYRVQERVVAYGTAIPALSESSAVAFEELEGKHYILFMSRVHPKKGLDLLLGAFMNLSERFPDLHLVIAGPYEEAYRAELESKLSAGTARDRIHWLGMVQGDAKAKLLRSADAFALPSHQENFGIAVVEALAAGTPVLISRRVNIWREIEDDGAGFSDEDTGLGMEALLGRWMELSQSRKEEMSLAARRCYQGRFTIEQSAKGLLEVLDGVVKVG